jgi:hypothetical protein
MNSMNDGGPNCRNCGLKSFEVSGRFHPVYPFAVRTSNPPQPNRRHESVEKGKYKAVKPEPTASASGATLGAGPRKIAPLLQNFIERNTNCKYHRTTFWTGQSKPVHASGGSSAKATARFISQLSPGPDPWSIYAEKFPPMSGLF